MRWSTGEATVERLLAAGHIEPDSGGPGGRRLLARTGAP